MSKAATIQRLHWRDPEIGSLAFPGGTMTLRHGFGSGLATRRGDPPGHFWAVGDRGPNIKVGDAIRCYGLDHLAKLAGVPGAKIMPRVDVGPALAQFRLTGDSIDLLRIIPLKNKAGQAITGLPNPGTDELLSEPVFDTDGSPLPPDSDGLDTEGVAALSDGSFWVGDEFGPSLVRVGADGGIIKRLLPTAKPGGVTSGLPAIAAKRQLNRGFEALTISDDERWLFLAFQSPLAHPDEESHRRGRHVRIWQMDLHTETVTAQFAYPLDPPQSFARDIALGAFERSDIKVSELLWQPDRSLMVLERGSATTKIYRCSLDAAPLDASHLDVATRPTLEELSASDSEALSVLTKELLFSSDDHPDMSADLEGMAMLAPGELLLVNDNDFGVQGAETVFWRVTLPQRS